MRLALFETSGLPCAIPLDNVLNILTEPHIFRLPLIRPCFAGGLVYQGKITPLMVGSCVGIGDDNRNQSPAFAIVCEAEFGLVAIPANRIIRITKTGEIDLELVPSGDFQGKKCEIDGCNYRLLDLNRVLEDPTFTVCGLKD